MKESFLRSTGYRERGACLPRRKEIRLREGGKKGLVIERYQNLTYATAY